MKTLTLFIMVWGISASHLTIKKQTNKPLTIAACESRELLREQMVELINRARAESRVCGELPFSSAPPLIWNETLEGAALSHSVNMARKNFFAHRGPGGTHVGNRVDSLGYNWRVVGENIYGGIDTVVEAVEGWLESPGHCKNIMNPDFTEVGAACVQNTRSHYESYWTQVFASPMY